jgi:hypothetical protein
MVLRPFFRGLVRKADYSPVDYFNQLILVVWRRQPAWSIRREKYFSKLPGKIKLQLVFQDQKLIVSILTEKLICLLLACTLQVAGHFYSVVGLLP